MKTEAPHYSYPKRDRYFADTKRLGRAAEAPYMDAPFDWTETQGDLAPVVRKAERILFAAALVMFGWFSGCLMALYVINGVW